MATRLTPSCRVPASRANLSMVSLAFVVCAEVLQSPMIMRTKAVMRCFTDCPLNFVSIEIVKTESDRAFGGLKEKRQDLRRFLIARRVRRPDLRANGLEQLQRLR